MRKIYRFLVLMFVVLLIALPVFSATDMMPSKNHAGYVGKDGKAWYAGYFDYLYLTGGTGYEFKFTGTPTANRTVTFPDSSGTVAYSASTATYVFEGATADEYETTLSVVDPTADRTIYFPNATGTVIMNTAAAADAAASFQGIANGIKFEGATADEFEVSLDVADPTADAIFRLPVVAAGTYSLMSSTLATNAANIVNSVWGGTNQLIFEGATADEYETIIAPTDATADRTITLPNASGTAVVACGTTHDYAGDHADWTMTIADASCGYITTTNAAVGGANAILPSCVAGQYYTVYNTSGQTITLKVTGQTGATVATTKKGLFVCTGTDVLQVYTTP